MTKKRKKTSKFFVFVSFIFTLALTLVIADFCSNFITIKAFSNSNFSNGQNAYNIYAIALNSATQKTSAMEYASTMQKQSAAGFVYEKDNKFYVIASAYSELNDANLVKNNLENEGLKPEVIKIEVPAITFESNHTAPEMNALVGAVTIYKTVFDNLYDISVALDTQVSTEAECFLFVSDVNNLVSKAKLNFEAQFNGNLSTDILYIKLSLQDLYKKVEDLKNFTQNSTQTFSSKIKSTYLETISLNINLCENL